MIKMINHQYAAFCKREDALRTDLIAAVRHYIPTGKTLWFTNPADFYSPDTDLEVIKIVRAISEIGLHTEEDNGVNDIHEMEAFEDTATHWLLMILQQLELGNYVIEDELEEDTIL